MHLIFIMLFFHRPKYLKKPVNHFECVMLSTTFTARGSIVFIRKNNSVSLNTSPWGYAFTLHRIAITKQYSLLHTNPSALGAPFISTRIALLPYHKPGPSDRLSHRLRSQHKTFQHFTSAVESRIDFFPPARWY